MAIFKHLVGDDQILPFRQHQSNPLLEIRCGSGAGTDSLLDEPHSKDGRHTFQQDKGPKPAETRGAQE